MKKGDYVIKVITIKANKSATVRKVQKVSKGVVTLEGDESLTYDANTLKEIDPPMIFAGIYSELVEFDGGEVEKWGFK